MKTFLMILTISATFVGCSQHDAFNRFDISKERALSEENIQSSKISNKEKINGTVTATYLNKIYPDLYKGSEYFYVYLYTNQNSKEIEFELNGMPALMVEKLKNKNLYTHLTQSNVKWQEYYLVGFAQSDASLNLKIKDNNASSAILTFKKD